MASGRPILIAVGGEFNDPKSFRLLLRSPKDIMVLRKPRLWTLSRSVWILTLLATGVLVAVLLGGTARL